MTELRGASRVAMRLEVYTQPLLKPSVEPVLSRGLLFLLFDVFFSFSLLKFHSFTLSIHFVHSCLKGELLSSCLASFSIHHNISRAVCSSRVKRTKSANRQNNGTVSK